MITAVTILLCLLHILASVNGNCDTNPFTRSPCDRIKPVPDRLTCVLKLVLKLIKLKVKWVFLIL